MALRYYFYGGVVDMRKGMYSLAGLVGSELSRDALSGEVFIFMGARCQQVKLLWFQGDGFGLYYRKLEKGTFERPVGMGKGVELTAGELMCLMEGIVLKSVVHRTGGRWACSGETDHHHPTGKEKE